jgi:hypothetical protein
MMQLLKNTVGTVLLGKNMYAPSAPGMVRASSDITPRGHVVTCKSSRSVCASLPPPGVGYVYVIFFFLFLVFSWAEAAIETAGFKSS